MCMKLSTPIGCHRKYRSQYLVVVYRPWDVSRFFPVFHSDEHSLPLPSYSPFQVSILGESCTFFCHSSKLIFAVFSYRLSFPFHYLFFLPVVELMYMCLCWIHSLNESSNNKYLNLKFNGSTKFHGIFCNIIDNKISPFHLWKNSR